MNEKVYIVESSHGQYDESTTLLEGVYTNPIDAERLKDAVTAEYEEMKATDVDLNESMNNMTDNEVDAYMILFDRKCAGQNFNSCYVIEVELNKRLNL